MRMCIHCHQIRDAERLDYRNRGEAIPLDIQYEDDQLIVIDKPKGLVVHPAA